METQIISPGEFKTSPFKMFIRRLVDKFQPLKIICFAKTEHCSKTEGCFQDQESSKRCDYCLLMVTETATRIDHQVQDYSNLYYQNGTICILCHSKEAVLEAIKANNRFFVTLYSTGQLLYSQNGMSNFDFRTSFIPTESALKANNHYNHRLPLAEGFLRGAKECLENDDFNISTFMLHQVVEQCCILLVRVHLAYRSENHNLMRLLRLCCSFSDRPIKTFLSGCPDDERLFNILIKSYSGSRYGSGFFVAAEDARNLFTRITEFTTLTKEMCIAKIEELKHEALLYNQLQAESEVIVD